MGKRCVMATVGALAALSAIAAPGASAATEIGDSCAASAPTTGGTAVQLGVGGGNPLPISAPTSGVITKWGLNIAIPIPVVGERLKVLRPGAGPNEFTVVGETPVETVHTGSNSFATRIPIQAGDRLGGTGIGPTQAIFYCPSADAADMLGAVSGDPPVGSIQTLPPVTNARLALTATIEPDGDGDGYGDETQDKCPQSTSLQTDCPVVVLDSFAVPGKSKVVVVVGADIESPVTVSASVKLPKAGKKAKVSATAKLTKVTRTVTPGRFSRFALKFPTGLKQVLDELPTGKKLTMKITATATNLAGKVSEDATTLKLKGAS